MTNNRSKLIDKRRSQLSSWQTRTRRGQDALRMNQFIFCLIFLFFHTLVVKSQVIIKTTDSGPNQLYTEFILNKTRHNLLIFGEEHYKYENLEIEYGMASLMKEKLFTHHLIEVDPITTLKIQLIINDSTINYPNKGKGSYLDNLEYIYNSLKLKPEKIIGIAPIEQVKQSIETLKFYIVKRGYNDSLLILVKKCKGLRLQKNIGKLITYWDRNSYKYGDKNLDYALKCLNNSIINKEVDRDKALYSNYSTFINVFDSTISFGFLGKLHVARTKFNVGKIMYNGFISILNTNHSNLNVFTGIISYGIVDFSEKEYSSSKDFMESYRIPCYYIDTNNVVSTKCTNFIWFSKYFEIYILK